MDPSPTGAFEIALQPGQPFTNAQVDDFIIRTTNSNQCMLLGTTSNTPALMTLSNGNLTVRGDLNVVNGSIINNGTQVISSFFNSNADTGSNIFRNSRVAIGAPNHPEQFNVYGGNARFDSNAYVLQRLAVGGSNPTVALDVTGTAQISSNLLIGGNVETANPMYTGGFFIRKNSNAIAATTSLSAALDNIGIAAGQMTFSVPDKSSSNTFNFVASNAANVAAQISGDGRMAIGGMVSPAVGAPVLTVQGASNELLRLTNLAQSVTLGVDTGYGAYIGTTGGPHDLVVAPSNTERMRVKAVTGYVGIGTSNPGERLHVVGNTRIEGNLTVNGTTTVIDTDQTTTEQLVITNDGTGPALQITQLGEQPIADFYDDSNVLAVRVANGGNVGIGLSNPTYKLEVGAGGAGAIRASPSNALGLVINQTGATGHMAQFQVDNAPVLTIGRDGYFYDSNNQATWIPGAQVQWLSTTAPVLTVPASGALSNLAASASFRFVGTEVAYTFSTQNKVTTAPTILTGDYTLGLPYNLDATKYAAGTIVGELWLTTVNAAATLSNVFKAYARTSALTQSAVILRYLNGTTDASFTDFALNSTFTLQGTLVYSSSTFANTAPLPPSVIPAAFVQDAQGRVTFNYPGPGPHPNPARLDITETASNATAPALSVNATSNAPLLSLSAANMTKVYVTAQGSIGVGTSNPQTTLDVRGGDLRLEGTGGNTSFMSYAPIGSNAHIPVSAGKINGVNITSLNARTRASYASAAACVNTWTTRTSAANNSWTSVCWAPELSLFCAIANSGTGNRVMTSPDGITWTARTSAADNQWYSICWAPELSLFVAVSDNGTSNRVMTSPDGITWTARTSAADNQWYSICWAPELSLFVAVAYTGTGNRVMTSSDGITWTARTSAADNNWRSVCWSPELSMFCAVAISGTGNRVMTSPDGITWTARTSAANNVWTSVCWSPELSLFVAVAGSGTGNRVMTSPDGITWTARTSAVDNYWISVCWSPELSLFVSVAYSSTGNPVMTSPDGITWTTRIGAANNQWFSVCWAPELSIFVAVAQSGTGNRVMTSAIGMPNSKSVVKALPTQMTVLPNGDVSIAGNISAGNMGFFRNRIINGDMRIIQRGAPAANISGSGAKVYTLDRWWFAQNGTAGNTVTQTSSGLDGFQYCVRLQRPASNTSTNGFYYGQAFESIESSPFKGLSITVSFYLRKGSDLSGAIILYVTSGTGTDENAVNVAGGTWTGNNHFITYTLQIADVSTSWLRFSVNGVVPANCNQLSVMFVKNNVGTAGANDYIDITGVQLEKGTIVTPFEYRSYGIELQLCQRYYWKFANNYFTMNRTGGWKELTLTRPVEMRIKPVETYSTTEGSLYSDLSTNQVLAILLSGCSDAGHTAMSNYVANAEL